MEPAVVFTKRILIAISHAIERFALASTDGPCVMIAMFQRLTYFEREVEVYQRIAGHARLTLVGVAEDFPPRLPDGVVHVLLRPGEELARTWSVIALSPRAGAMLRCTDLETVEPAPTLEAGRRFFGNWSFRRQDAYSATVRLRGELAGRIDGEYLGALDEVLEQVLAYPATAAEARADAAIHQLAEHAQTAQRQRDSLARRVERTELRDHDPLTGLRTAGFIERFTAGAGAGTLPLMLLLVRVNGVAALRDTHGVRAELSVLTQTARILRRPLSPVDHAVRLGTEEFLLLMPARTPAQTEAIQAELTRSMADLPTVYPFLDLPATSVLTITRDRPLPLPTMFEALDHAERRGQTMVALPAG